RWTPPRPPRRATPRRTTPRRTTLDEDEPDRVGGAARVVALRFPRPRGSAGSDPRCRVTGRGRAAPTGRDPRGPRATGRPGDRDALERWAAEPGSAAAGRASQARRRRHARAVPLRLRARRPAPFRGHRVPWRGSLVRGSGRRAAAPRGGATDAPRAAA